MGNESASDRVYRGKRDQCINALVDYYSRHTVIMKGHWPTLRGRHEEWLKENFGADIAKQIIARVRFWNKNDW